MQSPQEEPAHLTWQDVFKQLSWIGNLANQLFGFFRQVLLQKWRVTLPLIIIFALLSLFLLYNRSQSYAVTTTFVYEELHPKIFGDMIDRLNELFYYDRLDKAAALLNLSPAQVKKISSIKSTDTQGRALINNYAFRQEPMVVTINLSGAINEDSLRKGITQYLNSNPYTSERLELKKQLLREEKRFVEDKMQTIDSLLTIFYAEEKLSPGEQASISIKSEEGKDAYEPLSFSRELMKRKAEIEDHLARPENVIAIDNFIVLPKAKMDPGSILKYGIVGAMAGYLFSCLIIFGLNFSSTIKQENAAP